jgi:hypothetical protein
MNPPDKASTGILSQTLFVVVSASMKIAMRATSRRIATTQAAILLLKPARDGDECRDVTASFSEILVPIAEFLRRLLCASPTFPTGRENRRFFAAEV